MRSDPAVLAEFETSEAIERAVDALSAAGYVRMEAYTPHPLPALEAKLGIARSRAPLLVLAGGIAGAAFAFLLQYWMNGIDYPLNVGSRPLFSAPAFIPITFETTVLFAALTAFATWLAVSRLPTLNAPLLAVEGFGATVDRFWLAVEARHPTFDLGRCAVHLRDAGAVRVVFMPETLS
jgi:hypothetical protein